MEPIGERVAAVEARLTVSERDRQNLWESIDELKDRLAEAEGIAASAKGRVSGMEHRMGELEKREAVSKHQMNLIIGTAGAIAAGIGAAAVWIVRELVWPAVEHLFHK